MFCWHFFIISLANANYTVLTLRIKETAKEIIFIEFWVLYFRIMLPKRYIFRKKKKLLKKINLKNYTKKSIYTDNFFFADDKYFFSFSRLKWVIAPWKDLECKETSIPKISFNDKPNAKKFKYIRNIYTKYLPIFGVVIFKLQNLSPL